MTEREGRYKPTGQYAPAAERLARMTTKSDGRWLWTGFTDPDGRGTIRVNRQNVLVHRFAWTLMHGPIPQGMCVCHHCDVPHCVRPDHLFLGTQQDNIRDMNQKGRRRGATKLTQEQVLAIYKRRRAGEPVQALGREFGIHHACISRIWLGRAYRHITAAHKEEK